MKRMSDKCMLAAMHHRAVAQFNANMRPKDGALYMAESEIAAFNMYECLKGARWLRPSDLSRASVSSRLHKSHIYVKASIFVSRKIDRVACTILLASTP